MKIGNINIDGKVVLAPLAGYTNKVYRTIMKETGASLVYSEMVSAKGLLYDNDKTWELLQVDENEHPMGLQLFGSDPQEMAAAAKILDQNTACDIIDINMGCPVRKVLKAYSGSYLLKDTTLIYDIVSNVVKSVHKPVTVKFRAGWDHQQINCVEVAQTLERAGASAIMIHGRTKSDLYSGKVNLDYIKMVKDSVKIPVIGNGDIKSLDDAIKMIDYTKVDAIAIGRGSLGNPWLIEEIDCYFKNKQYTPPTRDDKIKMLLRHFNDLIALKGEKIAVLEMRSLASWYVKGFSFSKEFKQKLVYVKNKVEMMNIINDYLINVKYEMSGE